MGKKFTKGNPGKPKGAETLVKKQARALFIEIMEGQVDNIQEALETVRAEDPAKYLDILAKLMPYFIPKKLEVNDTTPGKTNIPVVGWISANGKT